MKISLLVSTGRRAYFTTAGLSNLQKETVVLLFSYLYRNLGGELQSAIQSVTVQNVESYFQR